MTKRTPGWTAAIVLLMAATARAQESTSGPALTVCLTFSDGLEMGATLRSGVLAEVARVWRPLGVAVGMPEELKDACNRRILVKSDREAGPEHTAGETAIAWVSFVAGRAQWVVFVRMSHAAALVDAFSPGVRTLAQAETMLTKLVGRSLAHELGHVLLNSRGHDRSGLMRAQYGASDVLRDVRSAYALNARQLDRVFGRAPF